jgi:hypothetical protein
MTTERAPYLVCPQCRKFAMARAPKDSPWLRTYVATGNPLPVWSHEDGTALCPTFGPNGYQLVAEPIDPCRQLYSDMVDLHTEFDRWLDDEHVDRQRLLEELLRRLLSLADDALRQVRS